MIAIVNQKKEYDDHYTRLVIVSFAEVLLLSLPWTVDWGGRGALGEEFLRQFSDIDNARFFLFTDAEMDTIARLEAIHEGWIRHTEGHFHFAHEIARRSDRLVIQQDKPLLCHNTEHRPFAFVRAPLARL